MPVHLYIVADFIGTVRWHNKPSRKTDGELFIVYSKNKCGITKGTLTFLIPEYVEWTLPNETPGK